ncbi:MAG: hypothetical protein U0795_18365 [Pirellulales bacterium]
MLRLRQAEVAMNDGRLEEAYRLAAVPDFRAHRRGQTLVQRLAGLYVGRADEHLSAGRLDQARLDADRAQQLAGRTVPVTELIARITAAAEAQRQAVHQRQRTVEQARQRLARGEYSLAIGMVQDLGESVARQLQQDADVRQRDFQGACQKARRALDWQAWPEAVDAVADAGRLQSRDERYVALRRELIRLLQEHLDQSLREGRLDRTQNFLNWLTELDVDGETLGTWRRAWHECTRAVREIQQANYSAAARQLRAARQLLGEVSWLDEAIRTVAAMAEGQDQLWSGPLGLVLDSANLQQTAMLPAPRAGAGPRRSILPRVGEVAGGEREAAMSAGFVLHVGSAQGVWVVDRSCVRIGPMGRSQAVDIPLMGAGSAASIVIERLEEDYFLRSEVPVQVNGQGVTHKLLRHGDKIVLGERAGLLFSLPCPASNSAVLEVVGARLPRADTRHVVLLGDTLVVGPHRQAHLLNSSLTETLVIQARSGQLAARVGDHQIELPWGQTVEVGGMPVTVIPGSRPA